MEHLSIPQIADKLKISDNTVRRYMKRFKDCLPSPIKVGIVYKYPENTIELIGKIYTWYERGMSKNEIIGNLQNKDDDVASPTPPQPDKLDILGGKIDALTTAISGLTTLLTSNAATLPAAGQTIKALEGVRIKLLSDPILTPDPQADTDPQSEEIDAPTIQPSDRPLNMGSPPEKIGPNTPTTPTPTDKIKADTTTTPTGGVKNGESLKKPKDTKEKEPSYTLPPTGGDTIPTGSVTPDMEVDIEGYKGQVIKLILKLKAQGMILKDIKSELEGRGLKTFTGKTIWATGTIGNLYHKNK
ncbi:hypothetical protein HRM2_p00520 (plasmid) [Desulforapulum autotrophicum HRM2]|uniref:Transcriptional regulator (MerR family protein) n=1 Tax=Desulforapulum autotrophicum (strain ATCC 43914 / DSM 3382 / VKM B-1955 / HRM2) TaxID=177437 RepID=C0QMP4_DESAH|nr:MerR family transcriptional regulator [Desulforapulum autotrophicum]ACN18038.1 transcriptional regulator (MerR family protein) [Desulforapulum autotrophicum HRM2]ACN18046.1 hypothetical protein HRM2_p00520 [Desulforapulum autotrophicum HRM2]